MFSIGIVAHEKRRAHAEALADRVNGFISYDDGTLGCEKNHLQVYRKLASEKCRYAVVLEDDALPIEDDFLGQLASALAVAPMPVTSLYLGTSRPFEYQKRIRRALDKASQQYASWIVAKRLLHAVGVAIPTEAIDSMIDVIEQMPHPLPIDEAITIWAAMHSRGRSSVCYTVPSLVDHRDEESIARHRDGRPRIQPRHAHQFGARAKWDSTAVTL